MPYNFAADSFHTISLCLAAAILYADFVTEQSGLARNLRHRHFFLSAALLTVLG